MKKIAVLLLLCCVLLTGCFNYSSGDEKDKKEEVITVEKMSYKRLNEIVNNYSDYNNIDVIDTRSEDDYNEGHIIGSMNIPYSDLGDIIISKDREIVIYADSGTKSKQAAKYLITLGYKKVSYIAGIKNWPYDLEEY